MKKKLITDTSRRAESPQISVVMSVRNGAPFLQAAIDSILRQDFTAFEFLIVDDGSTDETPAILRRQTDTRIRVFHRPPSGLPASLNFAVRESKADLIARQDADDISEPTRLGRLLAALEAAPDASLAYSACQIDIESNRVVSIQPLPHSRVSAVLTSCVRTLVTRGKILFRKCVPRSQALIALTLCMRSPITHGSVLFRKRVFQEIGGYDERFAQSQDYDLWSRMIEAGRLVYCPEKLYRRRLHEQCVSFGKAEAQAKFARQIAKKNCQRFFQTDEVDATRIFEFLSQSKEQPMTVWLRFLRHDLPQLRHQSADVYLWAAFQLARSVPR